MEITVLNNDNTPTYEDWMEESVLFRHDNYSSLQHSTLLDMDKELWAAAAVPELRATAEGYLFEYDDVIVLRETGLAATREAWNSLVEGRYSAAYNESLRWHAGQQNRFAWWR